MLLNVSPFQPNPKKILKAVEHLDNGDVIIFPTDTVYAFGCDLYNKHAIEKISKLKGKDHKTHFSIICSDISQIADYTLPFSTTLFRMMKKSFPGPFTFILPANKKVQKLFDFNKSTIGIRIPENYIVLEMVRAFGHPIITTSVLNEQDDLLEYISEPATIYERYGKDVDVMIDGGTGNIQASTVVDATSGQPVIIRQGKGVLAA